MQECHTQVPITARLFFRSIVFNFTELQLDVEQEVAQLPSIFSFSLLLIQANSSCLHEDVKTSTDC